MNREKLIAKGKNLQLNISSFGFLFSSIVQYNQSKVKGIHELEEKLAALGQQVGLSVAEMLAVKDKYKKETKVLGVLGYINNSVWRYLFGKSADSLEKSNENENEYMIADNDPLISTFISTPKEIAQLNCGSFTAGIIQSILTGQQFPCSVTAHSVPEEGYPNRTVLLIKFK